MATAGHVAGPDAAQDPQGQQVWQHFSTHPKDLPMLKGHSARVLGMAGHIMTVDIAELILLVRADATCVAELLRVANGTLLFRGGQVTALDEAIIRLGRREVYNVLTTVAARSLFRPQSESLLQLMPKAFWQVQYEAVVTALCSASLSHNLQVGGYEDAFMLGLFGRVGRLGALLALGHLALTDALPLPADPLAFVAARPKMVARMGQDMQRTWQLDEALVARCVALSVEGPWAVRQDRLLHLVRLVQALLAAQNGGAEADEAEQALQASREGLGLAETQLPAVVRQLENVCAQVQGIIGPA